MSSTEYMRGWRERNREKMRVYNREYNKKWRKENGYAAEYRAEKKFPEKLYARRLLREAVKRGKIKRGNCEVCNKPKGQGHHDDYFKPLEVRWLCPLHHTQLHKPKKNK